MGEEEARKLVREAQKNLLEMVTMVKLCLSLRMEMQLLLNVQILNDDQDGSWMDLQQITDQNIITAHRCNLLWWYCKSR